MKLQNFQQAVQLAKEFKFDDSGFYESIKSNPTTLDNGITISGYYENWVGLYFDDENGYYSIQLQEDGWKLCYDDVSFCKVPKDLSKKLDEFRERELGEPERKMQDQKAFQSFQDELWRNYGPGRI